MRLRTLRGDTLIEVMLSISVFAVVALLAINMMNDGINTAQRTLETAMARNEIDAQAEALRFIHQSYVAERQKTSSESGFKQLWETIINQHVNKPSSLEDGEDDLKNGGLTAFDINNMDSCNIAYSSNENGHFSKYRSFILNTRLVLPDSNKKSPKYLDVSYNELLDTEIIINKERLAEASLYPRLIYKHNQHAAASTDTINMNQGESVTNLFNLVSSAEGIWIDVAGNNEANPRRSDYFDFYIRTCWQSAGTRVPSTLTTVVRLYNPEVLQ
ncbi:hypothetical protein IK110_00810 [Candidatus Saccharibacteria bacterium]|nr:hypothetical protein [Candidatus Saccharibacteria bacterium]